MATYSMQTNRQIIRKRNIEEDSWQHVADDGELPGGDVIVSLARFRDERAALLSREGRTGVRIPNDVVAAELAGELEGVDLVAIDFPIYRDGRAFSIARILRRKGFDGELRAVGNVLRDQLFFMERCGFDTYELEDGKSLENALEAFREFGVTYQDAIEPRSAPRSDA